MSGHTLTPKPEPRNPTPEIRNPKVLGADSEVLSGEDPKPTFISGFIVRQLVTEGVIRV